MVIHSCIESSCGTGSLDRASAFRCWVVLRYLIVYEYPERMSACRCNLDAVVAEMIHSGQNRAVTISGWWSVTSVKK